MRALVALADWLRKDFSVTLDGVFCWARACVCVGMWITRARVLVYKHITPQMRVNDYK